MDLALNNLKCLICHKTKPTQTILMVSWYMLFSLESSYIKLIYIYIYIYIILYIYIYIYIYIIPKEDELGMIPFENILEDSYKSPGVLSL